MGSYYVFFYTLGRFLWESKNHSPTTKVQDFSAVVFRGKKLRRLMMTLFFLVQRNAFYSIHTSLRNHANRLPTPPRDANYFYLAFLEGAERLLRYLGASIET